MRQTSGLVTDIMTLARLHATLDTVVEARQLIAELQGSAPHSPLERVGALFDEARELLRTILTPPARQPVGIPRSSV
jgi:hypothetical protein